jgi:outer membrane lipoprotein SlyB
MNTRMILLIAALMLSVNACGTTGDRYDNGYRNDDSYRSDRNDRNDNDHRRRYRCDACGVVRRIESYRGERRNSGGGAIVGAVVGGLLGNQIGKGDGRTAATVVGAVGGGFAGNSIEKHSNQTYYDISIKMDDGRRVVVTQTRLRSVREGSRVMIRNGRAELY